MEQYLPIVHLEKASLTGDPSLHVPPTKSLPCTDISVSNVLIADEAFALKTNKTRRYASLNKQTMDIRDAFADWFISLAGEIPWQYESITK